MQFSILILVPFLISAAIVLLLSPDQRVGRDRASR